MYYIVLFLAGLTGGFLSGLAGVGGGLIFIFILEEGLKLHGVPEAQLAAFVTANSIFVITFSSGAGSFEHFKKGEFDMKAVFSTAVVSIPMAWLIQHYIINEGLISLEVFNWIILSLLLLLIIKQLFQKSSNIRKDEKNVKPWKYSLAGATGGAVAAFSGLGGGVAMVPVLTGVLKLPIHKAKSISLGVIFCTAVMMSLFNLIYSPSYDTGFYQVGYVFLLDGVILVVGVLVTAKLGVRVARKISAKGVTIIFTILIVGLIIKKLWTITGGLHL